MFGILLILGKARESNAPNLAVGARQEVADAARRELCITEREHAIATAVRRTINPGEVPFERQVIRESITGSARQREFRVAASSGHCMAAT